MIKRLFKFTTVFLFILAVIPAISQEIPYFSEINTADEFIQISLEDNSREDLVRTAKFLAPASDDPSLLQTVYQNANLYRMHLEFMVNVFPERFGGLTTAEYMDMVLNSETRTYYAGALFQFRDRQGNNLYGFNVYSTPDSPPQPGDIQKLYNQLSQSMKLGPFAYSPITPANIEIAKRWENPGFPIYFPEGLVEPEFEAYSTGVNYGRIRRFSLADLENAVNNGAIGWQDIVVVDTAPMDVENVVAGIITGTRQGELSHVNVRALRRGTPNAYIQNPLQVFESLDGELIKLEITNDSYEITYPADLTDAEEWWTDNRPKIPPLKTPDDDYDRLVSLPAMKNLDFFDSLTQTFGGKSSQMGILYSVMSQGLFEMEQETPFLVDGFGIPFRYYHDFMVANHIPHHSDNTVLVTYETYIRSIMRDERFRSDSAYRRDSLEYFIDYMRDHGVVSQYLVTEIIAKIIEVFGSAEVKVRFRSSSNAEDDIAFNGAGLYDSTSVCVQDNLDGDEAGPSLCDPSKKNERTIERGLKKVWASLWKPIAYEEREYYQIDHTMARMGILVSRAFPNEDCNGVAFTGDPVTGCKDYYIINVQKGDESVVQPGTGIIPEKDILSIEMFFPQIERVRPSSLMPEGEWVLSDDQLFEIAMYLTDIEQKMPVDTGNFTREEIVFDIEFKYDQGQFIIKQIRPALMATAGKPPVQPEKVSLSVSGDTCLAANFNMQKTIREEYEVHSMIHFIPGNHSLPVETGEYELDLIDNYEFGPGREKLTPKSPGKIIVQQSDLSMSGEILRYDFMQTFLVNERELNLIIHGINLKSENKASYEIVLDHEMIINQLSASATFNASDFNSMIPYKTPSDDQGQIYLHNLLLENGQHVQLYEVIRRRIMGTGFVFAYLVYADIALDGGSIQENDYWNLVYTAQGHCWNAKFWVLFDEPIDGAYGVAVLTTTLQWGAITEAEVFLLDENLEHLRKLEIISYTKEEVPKLPDPTAVSSWFMY